MKRRNIFLVILALAGVGAGSAGCEPSPPANPTWAADVRPLLEARCLRCHSRVRSGDNFTGSGPPNYSLDYETWEELRDAPMTDLPRVAARASMMNVMLYVRAETVANLTYPIMPPAPAAHLPDWEIEMLDRWVKNPM